MNRTRVLCTANSPEEALQIGKQLEGEGINLEILHVSRESEHRAALSEDWDVALFDFGLPQYSIERAVEVHRKSGKDIPIIVIAKTIADKRAIEVLRLGVQGFVVKGHWKRLAKAVAQGVVEKRSRAQKRLSQEKFAASQKLEAIGRIACGVAHDFNNLATIIAWHAETLQEAMGSQNPLRTNVDEIVKATRSSQDLITQLLAFSRKQVFRLEVLDMNEILKTSESLMQGLLTDKIHLTIELAVEKLPIHADRSRIEQVIMNLVANARDAMPNGGSLSIETARVFLDESYGKAHFGEKPGHYALLVVTDTGHGMDMETSAHIFEPFYSTKLDQGGTGFGLATTYGVVKQSEGSIYVYSEEGVGTVFKVYLPLTSRPPETGAPSTQSSAGSANQECILVVEDNAPLRELVTDSLRHKGYEVIVASGPREALALVCIPDCEFDLLITDITMPGMNGRELSDALAAKGLYFRTLYMSGYSANTVIQQGTIESGIPFLEKPFTRKALLEKVRTTLDEDD